MPIVRLPRQLQKHTDHVHLHKFDGTSVNELINSLTKKYPALIGPVFSSDLQPAPFIGLFINGSMIDCEAAFLAPLPPHAELVIINAVAGG